MDSRFPVTRDEFYTLQMDIKHIQLVQSNQAERLARIERRQEQDASLKSVWQQHPFPGVLAGTPQYGPTHVSANDLYDADDPENLLSSLHLEPAEEGPVRRGAASRANSVRFDESALRQSDWASQSNRHSGEFAPSRPSSGMLMERSLSHKSDGRHSSTGHSVHSVHSLASGRASSFGLHTDTFAASSNEDDSPLDAPEPPPEFFILGSVPSIIRCWLTPHFAHNTIQYADLCTGSQKSLIDLSVLRELDLLDEVQRDVDGVCKIRIPVYLVEATVSERTHSSSTPGQIPSITATFEVTGLEQMEGNEFKKGIRVFIGSDTLRAHVADIFLSQNRMALIGNDREKLSVPFVRPEDDAVFKHICTTNLIPERPKLNANATPFVSGESRSQQAHAQDGLGGVVAGGDVQAEHDFETGPLSPMAEFSAAPGSMEGSRRPSEPNEEAERRIQDGSSPERLEAEPKEAVGNSSASVAESSEGSRQPSGGIWGSWRQGTPGGGPDMGQREGALLSGYQPAGRGSRNMKVLKPLKSGSTSARTGASYEPPPPSRTSGEHRRKSHGGTVAATAGGVSGGAANPEPGLSGGVRWESKRAVSTSVINPPRDARSTTSTTSTGSAAGTLPRSANPVGGASAFSWMNPAGGKAKSTAAAE